ncbi:MAG TPA: phosphoribosylformylglycinamidine cyclo-ligase [Syntrophomonadaceae bacterium]|nr:phosphoribosylformylglycinamidine cyclo-ligase [Syntrophomonadaceae bacterium]HRX20599.1 phosphoribosylformylglycinamidine cyclo-ligase [Syntrophomonadaceae bacterium]
MKDKEQMSYKTAGVDIEAAGQSVEMIKTWVEKTRRPEVLTGIGLFGGMFAFDTSKFKEPVLVSGTDGVGTKLKIAQMMQVHDTVGIDLVAMCVNDVLCHGAEPLFFLDYIGLGKLKPDLVEALVKGVSEGCVQAGCALIGGETAEMPGFYDVDEYDLAGFVVGAVERSRLIDGSQIEADDVIIGLPSSGIHSNGFSLVRKVLLEKAGVKLDEYAPELGRSWGEELLTPTRIYVKSILPLIREFDIKGIAHITGGGMPENIERIIPAGLQAVIESSQIKSQPIYEIIQTTGGIEKTEMFKTFNMGIGLAIVVSTRYYDKVLEALKNAGENPQLIGRIEAGNEGVVIR